MSSVAATAAAAAALVVKREISTQAYSVQAHGQVVVVVNFLGFGFIQCTIVRSACGGWYSDFVLLTLKLSLAAAESDFC